MVAMMIRRGADAAVRNRSGATCLIPAVQEGNVEIIDELIHAEPSILRYGKWCPLYESMKARRLNVTKQLIDLGYPIHQVDPDSYETSLHKAVRATTEDIYNENGAPPNMQNINLILSHGVSPDTKGGCDLTALHYAVRSYLVTGDIIALAIIQKLAPITTIESCCFRCVTEDAHYRMGDYPACFVRNVSRDEIVAFLLPLQAHLNCRCSMCIAFLQ
jgi:ankyrin repeat protein